MSHADPDKRREYNRAYYAAHRERWRRPPTEAKRERDRAYRAANRERIRERDHAYYAANRERWRAYRATNIERIRESERLRTRDPDAQREYKRKWAAANRERLRVKARERGRRRVSLAGAPVYIPSLPTDLQSVALLIQETRRELGIGRRRS